MNIKILSVLVGLAVASTAAAETLDVAQSVELMDALVEAGAEVDHQMTGDLVDVTDVTCFQQWLGPDLKAPVYGCELRSSTGDQLLVTGQTASQIFLRTAPDRIWGLRSDVVFVKARQIHCTFDRVTHSNRVTHSDGKDDATVCSVIKD